MKFENPDPETLIKP